MTRREKSRVADRRRKVAEWSLKGLTQQSIGDTLGVSQATVARDLEAIRQQWRDAAVRNFDEARGQQLEKLDLVETEAWAGWQRSQSPLQTGSSTETKAGRQTRASLKHSYGDPRFLDQIAKCIAQRCLLLGLHPVAATQEIDIHAGMSLEDRRENVFGLFTQLFKNEWAGAAGAGLDDDQPRGPGDARQPGEVAPGAPPDAPRPGPAAGP